MRNQGFPQWAIMLVGFIVFAGLVVLTFAFDSQLTTWKDSLQAVAALVNILGVFALFLAFMDYRAERKDRIADEKAREKARKAKEEHEEGIREFERVKIAMEFMSRYYDTPELKMIRDRLRKSNPVLSRHSLDDDKVRVMNFFESIAIAVERGCLKIEQVDRMLRLPILEVKLNEDMRKLWKTEDMSYEGFKYLIGRLDRYYKENGPAPKGW